MQAHYFRICYSAWHRHLFGLFIIAGSMVSGQVLAQPEIPSPGTSLNGKQLSAALPFYFEANQGQVPGNVKFITRTGGYYLYLGPSAAVLGLRTSRKEKNTKKAFEASSHTQYHFIQTQFIGANPDVKVIGLDKQPGKTNYLIGNNKKEWFTNIPHYAKVKYENLYPGIDLVYYMGESGLEYDFIVHPGADPDLIQLKFNNVKNSKIDKKENLLLEIADIQLKQHKPVSYQLAESDKEKIASAYKILKNNTIGFKLAAYNKSKLLIIDPVIDYSSYFGGTGSDRIQDIATDDTGPPAFTERFYLTGNTDSPNLAGQAPAVITGMALGGTDIFVARLTSPPDTSSPPTIDYITYIGGTGNEIGNGIKVFGNIAYVVGSTGSDQTTFPVSASASQTNYGGGVSDGFILGVNTTGASLSISTYFGFANFDTIQDLALDVSGNIQFALNYNVGVNQFSLPAVSNNTNTAMDIGGCSFSVSSGKVSTRAIFSDGGATYLAGTAFNTGLSCGTILSGTTLPIQTTATVPIGAVFQGGLTDAFVARIIYPTSVIGGAFFNTYTNLSYLGGSQTDEGLGITASGNALFITGYTTSTNAAMPPLFPTTAAAYNPAPLGGQDAYLARIDIGTVVPTMTLVESSFIGGNGTDKGNDIALVTPNPPLGVTITGTSDSSDFPINNFTPSGRPAGSNAYIMRFGDRPIPTDLVYSGMVGGSLNENSEALAIGQLGQTFIAGRTASTNFTAIDALQASNAGGATDGFFVKLANGADLAVSISGPTPLTINQPVRYRVTASNLGPEPVMLTNVAYTVPANHTVSSFTSNPPFVCGFVTQTINCNFGATNPGDTVFVDVDMTADIIGNYTHTASVKALDTFPVSVDPVPGNDNSVLAAQVLNPSFCDNRNKSSTSNNLIGPKTNQGQCVVKVSAANGGGGSIDFWMLSALLAFFLLLNYQHLQSKQQRVFTKKVSAIIRSKVKSWK